jgi:hypothetical protein
MSLIDSLTDEKKVKRALKVGLIAAGVRTALPSATVGKIACQTALAYGAGKAAEVGTDDASRVIAGAVGRVVKAVE